MKHFSKVVVASALLLSGLAAAPAAEAADDLELDVDADGVVTLEGLCLTVDASADVDHSEVSLPPLPELPDLPEVQDTPEIPGADLPELPDEADVLQLVVVLSDGTEKVLEGSLSAGLSATVDTPVDVAVASAYLSLSPGGSADAGLQVGLCDAGEVSDAAAGGDNGGGTPTTPPAAEPVTGTPGFTG